MKHFFKVTILASVVTAFIFGLSEFTSTKKLSAQAEASMVSGEYSFDGITWVSIPLVVERNPATRACTTTDVLKFNAGTVSGEPTY